MTIIYNAEPPQNMQMHSTPKIQINTQTTYKNIKRNLYGAKG